MWARVDLPEPDNPVNQNTLAKWAFSFSRAWRVPAPWNLTVLGECEEFMVLLHVEVHQWDTP
jgi:hypothetical protein